MVTLPNSVCPLIARAQGRAFHRRRGGDDRDGAAGRRFGDLASERATV